MTRLKTSKGTYMAKFKYKGRLITAATKEQAIRKAIAKAERGSRPTAEARSLKAGAGRAGKASRESVSASFGGDTYNVRDTRNWDNQVNVHVSKKGVSKRDIIDAVAANGLLSMTQEEARRYLAVEPCRDSSAKDVVELDVSHNVTKRGPARTEELLVLQGNYGYGWDDLCFYSANDPKQSAECKKDLKTYRENERNASHRVIRRRVQKDVDNLTQAREGMRPARSASSAARRARASVSMDDICVRDLNAFLDSQVGRAHMEAECSAGFVVECVYKALKALAPGDPLGKKTKVSELVSFLKTVKGQEAVESECSGGYVVDCIEYAMKGINANEESFMRGVNTLRDIEGSARRRVRSSARRARASSGMDSAAGALAKYLGIDASKVGEADDDYSHFEPDYTLSANGGVYVVYDNRRSAADAAADDLGEEFRYDYPILGAALSHYGWPVWSKFLRGRGNKRKLRSLFDDLNHEEFARHMQEDWCDGGAMDLSLDYRAFAEYNIKDLGPEWHLAQYDGKEMALDNGMLAYRVD